MQLKLSLIILFEAQAKNRNGLTLPYLVWLHGCKQEKQTSASGNYWTIHKKQPSQRTALIVILRTVSLWKFTNSVGEQKCLFHWSCSELTAYVTELRGFIRLESLFLLTLCLKKKSIWEGLPLFLDGYKLDVTALIYKWCLGTASFNT